MSLQDLLTVAKTYVSLRDRLNLAKWEARLVKQQQIVAAQRAELDALVAKDAEIRNSPTHGVVLSTHHPTYALRKSNGFIEIPVNIIVQNTWIYPVRLEKMTGEVTLLLPNGSERMEFPTYADEVPIAGMTGAGVQRLLSWLPGDGQVKVGTTQLLQLTVRPRAYCLWQGEKFTVEGVFTVIAILN